MLRGLAVRRLLRCTFALLVASSCGAPTFETNLQVRAVELPTQAAPGDDVPFTIELVPTGGPPGDWVPLLIAEADGCEASTTGTKLSWNDPTKWTATLKLPADCAGALELTLGVLEPTSGATLATLRPRIIHDRVRVGRVDVTASPDRAAKQRSGAWLIAAARYEVLRPWLGWLTAAVLAIIAALILRRRAAPTAAPRALPKLAALLPVGLYLVGALAVLDFIKDDAFISFRYARNLATGQGLVFNPGERLEGFTNFLWTVLLAPFAAMNVDLAQLTQWLGAGLMVALLLLVVRASRQFGAATALMAALWLSTSSTLVLYATSGMEQPLAALLAFASAVVLWRETPTRRDGVIAGLLAAAACMTRPELVLVAGLLGLWLVIDALRTRTLTPVLSGYAPAVIAPLLAFVAFRWAYFGALVPNTYWVKTGAGDLIWRAGLDTTRQMLGFNGIGALLLLTPFAFIDGTRRAQKLFMLVVTLAFFAFQYRVGSDEMHWYRLVVPALPFLALLAAMGLSNLVTRLGRVAGVVAWLLVIGVVSGNFLVTWRAYDGFDGHDSMPGRVEASIGRYLARHATPGSLVAAQDMGAAPFHAPDVRFLDLIGLMDSTIARTRHQLGLHAFVSEGRSAQEAAFSERMRDYFFKRAPEWTLLSAYPPKSREKEIALRFAQNPGLDALDGTLSGNNHHFDLWDDARFREGYVPVRTWRVTDDYYVSLFARRDVWERRPSALLTSPPADAAPRADFGDGLELLGARLPTEVTRRGEAVISTWWKLPASRSDEVRFVVGFTNERGEEVSYAHVPGDWLYGAERWREGDVLEDRVSFLLPAEVTAGTWQVFVTVKPGSTRVALGQLTVRERRLFERLLSP